MMIFSVREIVDRELNWLSYLIRQKKNAVLWHYPKRYPDERYEWGIDVRSITDPPLGRTYSMRIELYAVTDE